MSSYPLDVDTHMKAMSPYFQSKNSNYNQTQEERVVEIDKMFDVEPKDSMTPS